MMGIVLGVLSWIGKFLLALLLLLLLIAVLILFVPIRYAAEGRADRQEVDYQGEACISWLFGLVKLTFAAEKHGSRLTKSGGLTIAGISPREVRKKRKEKQRAKRKQNKKKRLEALKNEDPEKYEELKRAARKRREEAKAEDLDTVFPKMRTPHKEEPVDHESTPHETKTDPDSTGPDDESNDESNSKLSKLLAQVRNRLLRLTGKLFSFLIGGAISVFNIPGKTVAVVSEKLRRFREILENAREWAAFLAGSEFRGALSALLRALKKLLMHIGPKKLTLTSDFGFEDPSVTGRLLAAGSLLIPKFGNDIELHPYFDQSIQNGSVKMKGRVYVFRILWIGLLVLLNRDVRAAYRWFKTRDKGEE